MLSLLLMLIVISSGAPYNCTSLELLVYRDGTVRITMVLQTPEYLPMVEIPLLAPPQHLVVLDEEGLPLDYELRGLNLTVLTFGSSKVTLVYYTQALTGKRGAVWFLNVSSPFSFCVLLPRGALPISMSLVPYKAEARGNLTVLSFPPGKLDLCYTFAETPPPPPNTQGGRRIPSTLMIALLAALAAPACLLARRMLRRLPREELREEELMIIEALRRRGGQAFQYEIARELGLPKTTLWRHVRRLAERGIIKIEKRGRQNFLILEA